MTETLKGKIDVKSIGANKLFLHQGLGEGKLSNGKKIRLIMINQGVVLQIDDNEKGTSWKSYAVEWQSITKAIVDAVFPHSSQFMQFTGDD